jgi:hypothetical protein
MVALGWKPRIRECEQAKCCDHGGGRAQCGSDQESPYPVSPFRPTGKLLPQAFQEMIQTA